MVKDFFRACIELLISKYVHINVYLKLDTLFSEY